MILAAMWVFVKKGKGAPAKALVLIVVLGVATSGTGVFGLEFLDKFGVFMKTTQLLDLMRANPTPEAYSEALNSIAEGEIESPYSDAILSLALERPVSGLDSLLDEALVKASKPEIKTELTRAKETFQGKIQAVDALTEAMAQQNTLTPSRVRTFDAASQALIASRIHQLGRRPLPGQTMSADSLNAIKALDPSRVRSR